MADFLFFAEMAPKFWVDGEDMAGRVKFAWTAIRFLWIENHVSTRSLARELGVDREGFQKRIRDEGWQRKDVLSLDQTKRKIVEYEKLGNQEMAEKARRHLNYRAHEFELCCRVLRAMIREARAAE